MDNSKTKINLFPLFLLAAIGIGIGHLFGLFAGVIVAGIVYLVSTF
jgi:hypothetical protein